MDKAQIQGRMRELLAEYNELRIKLDELLSVNKVEEFEKKHRAALEKFKGLFTVEILSDHTIRPVDWADVEKNLLNEANVKAVAHGGEGYRFAYDSFGLPCFGNNAPKSQVIYAYDEVDAKRIIERLAKAYEVDTKRTKR